MESRTRAPPVLLYAVSDRNWKLGMAAVAFTLVNPVLFSPPEDTDAWMTRVVLAEEWWVEEQEQRVLGLTYPNLLNLLNIPLTGYAFASVYRKNRFERRLAGWVQ